MTKTERDLLDASSEIGRLVDTASWFTGRMAAHIEREHPGKRVDELTVGELTAIIKREGGKLEEALWTFLEGLPP